MRATLVSAVLLAALCNGCITTAAIAKPNQVSRPLLIGAAFADLVLITFLGGAIFDVTNESAVLAGIATTAVDLGTGCILGACSTLKP